MRVLKVAIPAVIAMAGFLFCTTASYGTPAYMKKEGVKSCTVCHAKIAAPAAMKENPNLNDTGKCYKANDHSLAKCNVKK